MAKACGLSKDAVHRIWRTFGLKPHRQDYFKISTDPFFVDKVVDIVGLYLKPAREGSGPVRRREEPDPGLERSQPLLPLGLGYRGR